MEQAIEIGNIVTIISTESGYNKKQGQVVEIVDDGDEDGPVGVKFHPNDMLHIVADENNCIVRHEIHELRIDPCWSLGHRALLAYPGMHHTLFELLFAFSPENPCMHEDCERNAARRCMINVWGCVYERDYCEEHGKIDGMMGESLPPCKKDYVPATPIRERAAA
jgi:hypothetical protein